MGEPRPLFVYIQTFQTIQILQQIIVKKCPSSIRRWDSNTQLTDCESPPLTTLGGMMGAFKWQFILFSCFSYWPRQYFIETKQMSYSSVVK